MKITRVETDLLRVPLPRPVSLPAPTGAVLLSTQGPARPAAGALALAPWQGIVACTSGNHRDGTSTAL